MARFIYRSALGDGGNVNDFIQNVGITSTVRTTTTNTYLDAQGDGYTFTGTAFAYSGLVPISGQASEIEFFTSSATLLKVSNLSTDLAVIYQSIQALGLTAALLSLTVGDDVMRGSGNNDVLDGGTGDDKVLGRGGDDLLHGGAGKDTLSGGGGADQFLYIAGSGTDRIIDFRDDNSPADDKIILTSDMYSSMVIYRGINGLVLRFADGDRLLVDGLELGDLDFFDFLLI